MEGVAGKIPAAISGIMQTGSWSEQVEPLTLG